MRIFCLGTGRSGTTTFARAMAHATNYTSAHESRVALRGDERLDYPDWHAEADNRLTWFLGPLAERFGDDAIYVHLTRDRDKVIDSFAERHRGRISILRAFGQGIISRRDPYSAEEWREVAATYVDTVESNVRHFLAGRAHTITMALEDPAAGFADLWQRAEVEGDFDAASAEFTVRHNAR